MMICKMLPILRSIFLVALLMSALCYVHAKKQDKQSDNTSGKGNNKKSTPTPTFFKNENWEKWMDRHRPLFQAEAESLEILSQQQVGMIDEMHDYQPAFNLTEEQIAQYLTGGKLGKLPKNYQHVVMKRDASSGAHFLHTKISGPSSALDLVLVEKLGGRRMKRSAHYADSNTWPSDIPYVIDSSYSSVSGGYYVPILKRVLKWISQRVCVTYHDETNNYNSSNPNWFTQHGYKFDSYLLVKTNPSGSCSAYRGAGKSAQTIYPCLGFQIMLHEFFHTLGGAHMQQNPLRDDYLSVNPDNIDPSYLGTYDKLDPSEYLTEYFDPESTLLYSPKTFQRNDLDTYFTIRDEEFVSDTVISEEEIVFKELNKVYRCNELFCGNSTTDCGPGYYTLRNGTCTCVCPRFYDPSTNCQTLIDKPSPVSWPNVPLVLFKPGMNTPCPSGFDQQHGGFSHEGVWLDLQIKLPDRYNTSGKTTYFEICTKTGPSPPDWELMPPGGAYCIIKPLGARCGFGQAAVLQFDSLSEVQYYGGLGDTTISGNSTTMKMCCSYQAHADMILDLPNKDPFRLVAKGGCPVVRGMRRYKAMVDIYTTVKAVTGPVTPQYYIFYYELQTFHCYFQPPVYGCHEEITLDAGNRSITLTTPGYTSGARVPDKRCFYIFHAPDGATLRLTFNDYDLEVAEDKFLIQRSHAWQEPYRLDNENFPSQVVSVSNGLYLEFWAGYETVSNKGVNFTVDVLPGEESCYNISQNGADYVGDTSISENYESCLPWAQAADCDDFPYQTPNAIWLLSNESDNKCRNPGGKLMGPWCYTYKNGTNCRRRYCDVCNYKKPVDVIKTCSSLMAEDPDFCNSGIQRFGCFKSCGFTQAQNSATSCSTPTIPADGVVEGELKPVYYVGEKVVIKCNFSYPGPAVNEIICLENGWTPLAYACDECPLDWVPYNDRCFKVFAEEKKTVTDALDICRSQGPSGTLFRVHDLDEQMMIKKYRQERGYPWHEAGWISGQLFAVNTSSNTGVWHFTDSNETMTYFNWTQFEDPNNAGLNCIRMYGQTGNYWLGDGWRTLQCGPNGGKSFYTCQLDKHDIECKDKIDDCEYILSTAPEFCINPKSIHLAEQYCHRSCGLCADNNQCTDPSSSTYGRTSLLPAVDPGDVMTFECNEGLYHVGGDLKRACSSSGAFLGQEPVCQATPVRTDVNLNSIRTRMDTLPRNNAYLLDHDGYRVPFDGKISAWFYYSDVPGDFYALVYRKNETSYSYIGSNLISGQADWPWRYNVPSADQIAVLKDDLVGFYSTHYNTLFVSKCDGALEKLLISPVATASSLNDLRNSSFSDTACIIPSFGFTVVP